MSVYRERHTSINSVVKVSFPKFKAYDNDGSGTWMRLRYDYTLKDLVNSEYVYTERLRVSPITCNTTYCLNSSTLTAYYKRRTRPYTLYKCLRKIKPKVVHMLSGTPRRLTKLFRGKK